MTDDGKSLRGAEKAAAKIRAYWQKRGHIVKTRIEEVKAKIEQ
jgi:hypothetical protein